MTTPSWTAPTTWAALGVPTAGDLNNQLRDNALHVAAPAMCQATRTSTQSIPSSVLTVVLLTSEDWDTDAFHSTSSNTSRLTIPSGLGGIYQLEANIQWTPSITGQRIVTLLKNGVAQTPNLDTALIPNAGVAPNTTAVRSISLAAGDYVELQVFQDSGGALTLTGAIFGCRKVSN